MSQHSKPGHFPEKQAVTVEKSEVEHELHYLRELNQKPFLSRLKGYVLLSGPGWLQSAITLGGGSLASSLFLGVLAGYSLLWLQPFAMVLGVIMLSTIGYVTLSTGERPLKAIREHVNPVLAWGWALAVAAANIVWCLPQYSLADGVVSQNLAPAVFGARDPETQEGGAILNSAASLFGEDSWMADNANKLLLSLLILIICTTITWSYDRGGWGLKLYETTLKLIVALIVLCFFGVVFVLTFSKSGGLDWSHIFAGLVPDFGQFFRPATTFEPLLAAIENEAARKFWSDLIVAKQQDVMIAAAATAVGINMTFLFPYSLLRKGWTRDYRGLSIFDLSTGMFIPYILATGCVVIASASQFHAEVAQGFKTDPATGMLVAPKEFEKDFNKMIDARAGALSTKETPITVEEQQLASTLIDRKAKHLAVALEPLTGPFVANIIFGLGVLAMTLSTISILMLISGFVIAEMAGVEAGGLVHRLGTLVAGVGGVFGPFIWGGASFYLAVPTSVIGFILLPFAYITFLLMLNSRSLLGSDRPRGTKRLVWNILAGFAALIATVGSAYMAWMKAKDWGTYGRPGLLVGIAVLVILGVITHFSSSRTTKLKP